MRHIQLNFAFQLFWIIFGENLLKTSLFCQKMTISESRSELLWKLIFLNNFCYGQILMNILFDGKMPFVQTSEIGQILTKKNVILNAKLFFSVVLNHSWEKFDEKFSLLSKYDYLRKKLRINLKVSISQKFLLWANPENFFLVGN